VQDSCEFVAPVFVNCLGVIWWCWSTEECSSG